jgi:hypothetical protein
MTQGQWHTGSLFESQEKDMMTMRTPDTPPYDRTAHARDLEALARETHVPFEDVAQLYDRELAALAAGARITYYLPVLATRKVRALLRHRRHPARAPAAVEAPAHTPPPEDPR